MIGSGPREMKTLGKIGFTLLETLTNFLACFTCHYVFVLELGRHLHQDSKDSNYLENRN